MEDEDIPDFCGYIVHRTLPSTLAITPAARRGSVAKKEPPHDGKCRGAYATPRARSVVLDILNTRRGMATLWQMPPKVPRVRPGTACATERSLAKTISKGIAALYQRFAEMQVLAIVAAMGYCSAGCKKVRRMRRSAMSSDATGSKERLHTLSIFGSHWLWLVLLGGVLMLAGAVAILVPAISEIAASRVLGSVLVISGLVQIVQAAKMLHWTGFIWHLLLGILATVGGALIYMDPFAGVVALTLLIAIISAVHGVTQVGFAVRVRGQAGWYWFLMSEIGRASCRGRVEVEGGAVGLRRRGMRGSEGAQED